MTKQWHGGKGSAQRTKNTKQFDDNWDLIFGKKKKTSEDTTKDKKNKEDKKI
tara:strand:- start:42 stop:197 length:156 start_codon:yes stop_codon:yes gene_type:complete